MKKLILKIFTVFLLAMIVQICTGSLFYPPELKPVIVGDKCANNIVFLGDSTIANYNENDTDKRPISSFLEDILKQKVIRVSHPGYHLCVFRDFVRYFIEHNKPKVIIIPINLRSMRSFSPEWDARPEYLFKKESFLLNHGVIWRSFYKPISIYTDYFKDSESKTTWSDANVYDDCILAGKVKDYENDSYKNITHASMKKKIIYHYRFNLKSKHRMIAALNEICILAKNNNLNVLFYITPLDIVYLDSIYKGTSDVINKNINSIKNVITSNGLSVIDMSSSISSEYFDWKENGYPNEHMNEKGRNFVAETLSKKLK